MCPSYSSNVSLSPERQLDAARGYPSKTDKRAHGIFGYKAPEFLLRGFMGEVFGNSFFPSL
jgi:hypothetical protein